MQRLQDPNRSNVDNLNDVRSEESRLCENKKMRYLKAKIDELETNSKIKKISEAYTGASEILRWVTRLLLRQ